MARIIFALLLAGGGAYLLRWHIQPELAQIERIRAEQTVVADAIGQAREVIRLRDELLGRYNSIAAEDIDKIRKFLPAGSALSDLFIDINTMSQQSGAHITSITFSEDEEVPANLPDVGNALTVTLDVDGTYEQFLSFLGLIEKNLRLIDVVGITLGDTKDKEKNKNFGFKVILRSYYQERTIL